MPTVENIGLDQHLVLLAWLNRQFGYDSTLELLRDMKNADEGFDIYDGYSHVYHKLRGRGDAVLVAPEVLERYDKNIHKS